MCDMTSHFPSASAGGYPASSHDQYSANGYDRHHHHLHQPPPPPPPQPQSLHPSSGSAHHHHHQAQYTPLQYGHYRFGPTSFDRLPNDGPNSHPESSPGQHFGWSAPQPPPPPPPPQQQQQPSAQVFSQAYDSCSNRAVLTPPHDAHEAYATCKLQTGLDSGVIGASPPPSHHNSHQSLYPVAGVPSPGSQANPAAGNNLSPLYPWMRSQFGQYAFFLIFMPVLLSPVLGLSCILLTSAVTRVAL